MSTNIGIIGGGLSGTATLVHLVGNLAKRHVKGVTITIFDPSPSIGPGSAYALDLPDSLILNHENNYMGSVNHAMLEKDTRTDFWAWMKENALELQKKSPSVTPNDGNAFSPRHIYGAYLVERYAQAKQFAVEHGITIREVHAPVDALSQHEKYWDIGYNENGLHHKQSFQQVFLCNGHWYREFPASWRNTGCAFSAYPPQAYTKGIAHNPEATLLIRGTSLSAVDAAIAALESGQYAHVTMASRHGQLHALRGPKSPYQPQHLTIERLEAEFPGKPFPLKRIAELLQQEIVDAYKAKGQQPPDWEAILHPKDMKKFLEDQLNQINRGEEFIWRSVLDAVDINRQSIYGRMTPEDQAAFTQDYRNLYLSYRAAMPPVNGAKLLKYMNEGKLTVTGGMINLTYDDTRKKFTAETAHYANGTPYVTVSGLETLRPGTTSRKIETDAVVDAIGPSRNIRSVPLFNQMLATGIAKEHALGGLTLGNHMCVLDKEGNPQAGLYAIGNLSEGQHVHHLSSLNITDNSRKVTAHVAEEIAQFPAPSHPADTRVTGESKTAALAVNPAISLPDF